MASDAVEVVADATGCVNVKSAENLLYTRVVATLLLGIHLADIVTNVAVLIPFIQALVSSCDDGTTGFCTLIDTYNCTDVVLQALEEFESTEGVSFLPGASYNFGQKNDDVEIPNYKNETLSVLLKAFVPKDFELEEHTFGFDIQYDNGNSPSFPMKSCSLVSTIPLEGDGCLSDLNETDVIVTQTCFYSSSPLDSLGVSVGNIGSFGAPQQKIPLGIVALVVVLGLTLVILMSLYFFFTNRKGTLNLQTVVERWLISFKCLGSLDRDQYKAILASSREGVSVSVVGLVIDVFVDIGSVILAIYYWILFSSTKVSGDLLAEISISLSILTVFSLSCRGIGSLLQSRPKWARVLSLVCMAGCFYAFQILITNFALGNQANLDFGARAAILITIPFTAGLVLLQIIHIVCFEQSSKPDDNKVDNVKMNSLL